MNDPPSQVHVHLVESNAPPTASASLVCRPVLPAFDNAIFAATGKRVRELPLSKTKLV